MLKDRFEDGDIGKLILPLDQLFVHNDYMDGTVDLRYVNQMFSQGYSFAAVF